MKKLLGIVVLSLLLSGCVSAPSSQVQKEFIDRGMIKIGMNMSDLLSLIDSIESQALVPNASDPKYIFLRSSYYGHVYLGEATNSNPRSNRAPWTTMIGWKLENYKLIKIYENSVEAYDHLISLEKNAKTKKYWLTLKANHIKYKKNISKTNQSNADSLLSEIPDIEFTITDKKKQCEAIGFEPATEKFADCVLRLVELDVKTQQTNQIALAQSQGNLQVANQLKKQRNDQSSQYFLDLGQKLLNPQSTVSAPSTSTCRVTGGVYKTISCW